MVGTLTSLKVIVHCMKSANYSLLKSELSQSFNTAVLLGDCSLPFQFN